MTTVVDPLGTPSPIYNRNGVTIVNVAAGGSGQSDATPIPAVSGHTVALVGGSGGGVLLPSGSDIGDVVEVYIVPPDNEARVFPASGETLNSGVQPNIALTVSLGGYFRKTSSTNWQSIGGLAF